MDPYQILKTLQDSGQFDKFRAEIFARPAVQSQFESIQQCLIKELSSSPLLDVPLKLRQAKLSQIFNSFRLAVRKTSVANDIHSILWTVINEMAPEIYSAVQWAGIPRPAADDVGKHSNPPKAGQHTADTQGDRVVPAAIESATGKETDTQSAVGLRSDAKPAEGPTTEKIIGSESNQPVRTTTDKKRGRDAEVGRENAVKGGSRSTSDDDYVPAQKKTSVTTLTNPQEPISKRVEIWWPLDKTWYKGTVTAFRARDKKHHIRYDDNEIEWLDLLKEKWRYEQ